MAHYLSEVTLQKLDSRREDFGPDFGFEGGSPNKHGRSEVAGHDTLGLQHSHDLMGYLRAATVSSKQDTYGELHKVVWCGEQDGLIVVRDWGSGEPIVNIERKSKVFVFSLVTVGDLVWAGLSDGYIRVFEGATCSLLDEVKAHCGAILSMVLIPPQSQDRRSLHSSFNSGLVCTGSNDWTIGIWDTETLQCLGRLNGHQNAVRCLASPMTLSEVPSDLSNSPQRTAALYSPILISGSDDGCIKCWNLMQREEIIHRPAEIQSESGWPNMHVHKRGVTAVIILPTSVVLTSGQDGICNAYDLATGVCIQQVEQRPCAILSLMYDEVMDHVWIGGMDGIISLYETQSLQRLTSLFAHSGTYVAGLKALARTNVLKVWTLDAQSGTVMEAVFGDSAKDWIPARDPYQNSGNPEAYEASPAHRQLLQQQEIDQLREETLQNYQKLDQYRSKLRVIEDRDIRQREGVSAKLGDHSSLKREYLVKVKEWFEKRKLMRRQQALANWLGRFSQRLVSRRFLNKWLHHITAKFEIRRKAAISDGLMKNDEATLKARYCLMLFDAAQREDRKRRMLRTAELFVSTTKRGLQAHYYNIWQRFKKQRHFANSQQKVIRVIAGRLEDEVVKLYWSKLIDMLQEERVFKAKCNTIDVLLRTNKRTMLYAYFDTWQRFLVTYRNTKLQRNVSVLLSARRTPGTMRSCFRVWVNYLSFSKKKKAEEHAEAVRKEREMWDALVSGEDDSLNPDKIASERALVEQQLELRRYQREELEDDMHSCSVEVNAMQREVMSLSEGYGFHEAFDQDMVPSQRAAILMALLKSKGINCFHDLSFVEEARARAEQPIEGNNSRPSATTPSRSRPGMSPRTPVSARGNPVQEKAKLAAQHFVVKLRMIQQSLFTALRYQGFRIKDFQVPEEDPMANNGRKLDWGIPVSFIESLKPKERRELYGLMKGLVVVWDIATGEGQCCIEDVSWAEFISNSHLFLKMTDTEFERVQTERLMGAGQEYEKASSFRKMTSNASMLSVQSGPKSPATAGAKRPTTPLGKKRPASPSASKRPTTPSGKKVAGTRTGTSPAPGPRSTTTAPKATPPRPTAGGGPSPSAAAPKPSGKPGAMGFQAGKPWLGIKLAANKVVPTAQEKAAGIRTAKVTVEVSDCTEGSPAFDAGIRVGDRLHRFGGFIITDIPSFNAVAAKQVKVGAQIPVQHVPHGATDLMVCMVNVRAREE